MHFLVQIWDQRMTVAKEARKLSSSLAALSILFVPLLTIFSRPSPVSALNTITHLPGFHGTLPFYLETGYVKVDEVNDAQLFYYFIKSEGKPEEDPLIVWLTGGPGCSAFSGLVFEIGDQDGDELLYNLKGYLVGNPATDEKFDNGAFVPYAHGMGLISDELYESTKKSCGGEYASPRNEQCANHLQSINECIKGINTVQILEPVCFFASPKPGIVAAYSRRLLKEDIKGFPLLKADLSLECRTSGYLLSYFWADNDTVREALNIHKGTVQQWQRCNYGLPYAHDIPSSLKFHLNLTSRGYRALVYSGDHDLLVPFVGTQAWIRSLNFSIVDDWRPWSADGQVAGFTRTYSNNLTFATVKGAGHTAPEYRPKECLVMLQRWLSGAPL
ncbi:serine carboxypeptidase-like 18 isoform X1 [Elaeis guineensis]|uniref:serine carboxypeptidase-like 18 isoform X1 n=1 Tax=Elaeis guineensis var. tenera TaxID=51953 RepID=UPI003C6D5C5C